MLTYVTRTLSPWHIASACVPAGRGDHLSNSLSSDQCVKVVRLCWIFAEYSQTAPYSSLENTWGWNSVLFSMWHKTVTARRGPTAACQCAQPLGHDTLQTCIRESTGIRYPRTCLVGLEACAFTMFRHWGVAVQAPQTMAALAAVMERLSGGKARSRL